MFLYKNIILYIYIYMISYVLHKLGIYSELDYIRNNLKHTKTLNKKFYKPDPKEVLNKMILICYKNKLNFTSDDLINAKKKLQNVNIKS